MDGPIFAAMSLFNVRLHLEIDLAKNSLRLSIDHVGLASHMHCPLSHISGHMEEG